MEAIEEENSKTTEVKKLVKNATDLQRLKLERLMKNPVSFMIKLVMYNIDQSEKL